MEVNKKQLADIFGASIRTIQNWQEQGMPVLRGGGKGNEVLYDSAAVIKWYAERDAEIENENLRREVEELRQASETDLQPPAPLAAGNQRRILKNGCRIVSQFGVVIGIICVCFKR